MSNESKCPSPTCRARGRPRACKSNRDWWPKQLNLNIPASAPPCLQPVGCRLRLRRRIPEVGLRRPQARPRHPDDRFPTLVACRLGHYGNGLFIHAWPGVPAPTARQPGAAAAFGNQRFARSIAGRTTATWTRARRLLLACVKQKYSNPHLLGSGLGSSWPATWRWNPWVSGLSAFGGSRRQIWRRKRHLLGQGSCLAGRPTRRPRPPAGYAQLRRRANGPHLRWYQEAGKRKTPISRAGRDAPRNNFARMAMNDRRNPLALIAGGHLQQGPRRGQQPPWSAA